MKLWKISQEYNEGPETWDSAVVAAETKEQARLTHPNGCPGWDGKTSVWTDWCGVEHVTAELIGEAVIGTEPGVIVASFNAG